jgi:hypothetical protein
MSNVRRHKAVHHGMAIYTAECRLCGSASPLQESHVIPKAFFRRIKRKGPALQSHDHPFIRNRPTQESWSQKLLCLPCEQKLSNWEGYAIDVLRFPARRKVIVRKSRHEWEFFNVDYNAFRLFQLAVLFRSAISTHEAFEHVAFADAELDRMRYQINRGEAPDIDLYPCLMEVLLEEDSPKTLCERIIGAPKTHNDGSQTYIWFVFGGLSWYFVFPKLSSEELEYESYLNKGGYMRLPAMLPWEHPWLRQSMAQTVVKSLFE